MKRRRLQFEMLDNRQLLTSLIGDGMSGCVGCDTLNLIVGRVYHAENMQPFDLPGGKNISGMKSNSSEGGGGYNEFVLDDTRLSEGSDRTHTVGKNETVTIALTRTHSVGVNETISVGAAQQVTVGAVRAITVGAAQQTSIGTNHSESVGDNHIEDAGKKLSVNSGDQDSLTADKASIVMKKDGTITITGKDITITGKEQIAGTATKDIVLKGKKILQN